jgi:hypothetical protein
MGVNIVFHLVYYTQGNGCMVHYIRHSVQVMHLPAYAPFRKYGADTEYLVVCTQ